MSLAERQPRQYACRACGAIRDAWSARCPSCQSLRGMEVWTPGSAPATARTKTETASPLPGEVVRLPTPALRPRQQHRESEPEGRAEVEADPDVRAHVPPPVPLSVPVSIVDVDVSARETRIETGIEPLDRVLGGGIVVGSFVLIGGDPGAGKSTLLMQMVAQASCEGPRLYATGEESVAQVAMRAHRVGAALPDIKIVRETDVDAIIWHAVDQEARLLVVDSIHAITSSRVSGIAGSDYQVKACAQLLMAFAKDTGTATIVISHVNKDGVISGPKNFEHAGDVTLMLETSELGDPSNPWRTLRAAKNRFGSTLEVGAFQMAPAGLLPVDQGGESESSRASASHDEMLPVAQELAYRVLELGGEIDPGLRDRIGGRLDLAPRGAP